MAKANLTLPDGTSVVIEGTPEEVSALLERISGTETTRRPAGRARGGAAQPRRVSGERTKARAKGPVDYTRELIKSNYFKEKRGLGDVRKKLEEGGHIYPNTHLSPALVRLVRSRELRRIKENKAWKYVNP